MQSLQEILKAQPLTSPASARLRLMIQEILEPWKKDRLMLYTDTALEAMHDRITQEINDLKAAINERDFVHPETRTEVRKYEECQNAIAEILMMRQYVKKTPHPQTMASES
jgi:hypothetical protein